MTIRTWALAMLVGCGLLLGEVPAAHACSCIGRTPAEYLQGADEVFLGRATGQGGLAGEAAWLEVLHVLKGQPDSRVPIPVTAALRSTCDRGFKPGEVALVFARKGKFSICGGNLSLDVVLGDLGTYLRLSGLREEPAPPGALQAARELLPGATQGQVSQRHGPLAVLSLDLAPGRRQLVLLRSRAGKGSGWEVVYWLEQLRCRPRPGTPDGWQPFAWGACRH